MKLLSDKHLSRCYFPDAVNVVAVELHGFSDAVVVYLRMIDSTGGIHLSIVTPFLVWCLFTCTIAASHSACIQSTTELHLCLD